MCVCVCVFMMPKCGGQRTTNEGALSLFHHVDPEIRLGRELLYLLSHLAGLLGSIPDGWLFPVHHDDSGHCMGQRAKTLSQET